MTQKISITIPMAFSSYLLNVITPINELTLQEATLAEVRDKLMNNLYAWITAKKDTVKLKISIPFAIAINKRLADTPLPADAWLANEHIALHGQIDQQLIQIYNFYKSNLHESKGIESPRRGLKSVGKSPNGLNRLYARGLHNGEEVEVVGRSEDDPSKMVIRNASGDLYEIIEEALELLKEVPEVVSFFKKVGQFFRKLFNVKPKA